MGTWIASIVGDELKYVSTVSLCHINTRVSLHRHLTRVCHVTELHQSEVDAARLNYNLQNDDD